MEVQRETDKEIWTHRHRDLIEVEDESFDDCGDNVWCYVSFVERIVVQPDNS